MQFLYKDFLEVFVDLKFYSNWPVIYFIDHLNWIKTVPILDDFMSIKIKEIKKS
jgi:hypothetical protein